MRGEVNMVDRDVPRAERLLQRDMVSSEFAGYQVEPGSLLIQAIGKSNFSFFIFFI